MRQKCVKNASEMRQNGSCLLGKEDVQNASEIRQKCVKNARNTFGGEHLLDDTDDGPLPVCSCGLQGCDSIACDAVAADSVALD